MHEIEMSAHMLPIVVIIQYDINATKNIMFSFFSINWKTLTVFFSLFFRSQNEKCVKPSIINYDWQPVDLNGSLIKYPFFTYSLIHSLTHSIFFAALGLSLVPIDTHSRCMAPAYTMTIICSVFFFLTQMTTSN